jgi:CRISPR system CASCADE complex protein casB
MESVRNVTVKILNELYAMQEYSTGKAILSRLRNSIGRDYVDMADVMPFVFENLPTDFLGNSRKMTDEEVVILTCLQLYAISQQGENECAFKSGEGYSNIGTDLKGLRTGDDSTAVDRRFNAMITSAEFDELIVHLRHMIRLLKSKQKNAKVDYGRLAEDLYWIRKNKNKDSIILNWAREYYKFDSKDNKGESNEQ